MKSFLLLAAIAAIEPASAQWGHKHHPGDPPYQPFLPHHHWPHKHPSPPPPSNRPPVIPKLKNEARIIGLADDPALDRDSCGSVTFIDRTFWTCRDTQLFYKNGSVQVAPVITSTGSWTEFARGGGPALKPLPEGADPLHTIVLEQYGKNSIEKAFFPVTDKFCGDPTGSCPDQTRYAMWPDLPPMVAQSDRRGVTAYTWIRESHIRGDLSTVTTNPATTLYRVNYSPTRFGRKDSLPEVTILDQAFWKDGEISFGNYGNVVKDGIAYLYGQANGSTSLAKVSASQVENKSAYQYWVNGKWTREMPQLGQDGINITNANAGGQGTYFYSEPWQSYVWIGGPNNVGSDMYITTAPDPTGPWIEPIHFFSGVNGDYFLGAYSIQAHPGLTTDPRSKSIYITYTKNDLDQDGINVYTSPLVYAEFE